MSLSDNISSNVTDQDVEFVFRNDIWLFDLIIDSLLAIVSLYLLSSLIRHRAKRVKLRARGQEKFSKETRYSCFAKNICVLISFVSTLFQFFSLGNLYLERFDYRSNATSEDDWRLPQGVCQVLPKVRILVLIIGTGLVYLFLWTRQKVFYVNPSLKVLNSKLVKATSYSVLIFWLLYFATVSLIYLIVIQYERLFPEGCVLMKKSRVVFRSIIVSWLCVSVAMQITLLALFIKPILNRMTLKGHETRRSKSFSRLLKRLKRAVALTGLCLLSDIVSGVCVILFFKPKSNNYTFPYNINVAVNLFAVIGCFDYWFAILWPCTNHFKDPAARYSETSRKFSNSFTPRYSQAAASFTVVKTKSAASQRTERKINFDDTLLPSDVHIVSSTATFENV